MNSIIEISDQKVSKVLEVHQCIVKNLFYLYDFMLKDNNNDMLLIKYLLLIFEYISLSTNIFHDEVSLYNFINILINL